MNMKRFLRAAALLLLTLTCSCGGLWAAEIITDEDVKKKIVATDVLVKTADNAIFIVDTSTSMAAASKKYRPKTKYELEKQSLTTGIFALPDLGFNLGIYSFTPWEAIYPTQSFDRLAASDALGKLPTEATGRTPLVEGLGHLENILRGLSGKTIVYLFTDGGYDRVIANRDPGDRAAEIAAGYDVCFQVIDHSATPQGRKTVRDIGKANACSRVIPFDAYITDPYYALSPLYYVKTDTNVITTVEKEIVGIKLDNIYFDFDKSELKPGGRKELDALGDFLKAHESASAYFLGYTDSVGTIDYNIGLSRRRAEAAASYVAEEFNIDPVRLVTSWYGESNPAASNDTAAGRALNRRVEIVVGSR